MNAPAFPARTPTLDDIELIEPAHIYRRKSDRMILPGVTGTMREVGLGFTGFAPIEALNRGNFVHEGSVYVDDGSLDWGSVPLEWAGYLRAYERAKREREFTPTHAEWRFWHPQYGYAGTLDRIGLRRGRRGQVELKTGSIRHVWIQAAAYDRGFKFWFPNLAIEWSECWQLHENGTYSVYEFGRDTPSLDEGWNDFAACLRIVARRRDR